MISPYAGCEFIYWLKSADQMIAKFLPFLS